MKSMKLILYAFLLSIILFGCNGDNDGYEGIPITAELVAEDSHYAVFTNIEGYEDSTRYSPHDPPLEEVSLWAYDKQKHKAQRMMLSHLNTLGDRYNTTESFRVPVDSIRTIHKVIIISFPEEPLIGKGNASAQWMQ